MKHEKKIGLALSGGGYRAAVYHLGTIQKLKEMDLLDKIDVISSNSGGSITAAAFGLYGNDYEKFKSVVLQGVGKSVIRKMIFSPHFLIPASALIVIIISAVALLFTDFAWLSPLVMILTIALFLTYQFKIFRLSALTEKIYNDFFFKKNRLNDLSPGVTIVLNSTNMETGRLFTFSRDGIGDSTYQYPKDGSDPIHFLHREFPVAKAVAASTSVPFLFSPVEIPICFYKRKSDSSRAKPRLVDGGVYDNQGVHKLAQLNSPYECDTIIVSDAGNELPFKNSYQNVLTLLIRVSDVFMTRIRNLQMIHLIFNPQNKEEVAYQSLGWDVGDSIPNFVDNVLEGNVSDTVVQAHGISKEDIAGRKRDSIIKYLKERIDFQKIQKQSNSKEDLALARSVGTNLTALDQNQIQALITHASVLTELNVKLYCPSLVDS